MNIAGREIGVNFTPFVVAEISGEHLGIYGKCRSLIAAAKEAGADAAKLQCFNPEKLAKARGGADKVLTDGLWKGRTLLDLYEETETPNDWFPDLFAYAKELGITLFSSVFDVEDVDYLENLSCCPAYKVSAYEFRDQDLIAKVASTRKPMIVSVPNTATIEDITHAMVAADSLRNNKIAWLHCVSKYPCPDDEADLDRIKGFRHLFEKQGWVVGFSDHTIGINAAVEATRRGASIIEKHITLSRADGGPDAVFSLEPSELKQLVQGVRDAYAATH